MIETDGSTPQAERNAEAPLQEHERKAFLQEVREVIHEVGEAILGLRVLMCWEDGTPAIEEVDGQTFIIERGDGKVTVRGVGQEGEGV